MSRKQAIIGAFAVAAIGFSMPAFSRPPATPPPIYYDMDVFAPGGASLGSLQVGSTSEQSTGQGIGNSNENSDAGGASSATMGDQSIIVHNQSSDFPAMSFFDIFTEIQIPNGSLGSMTIGVDNESGQSQSISDAGFMLSPTYIPLDDLNPTNYPDSMFTPIPSLSESDPNTQTDSANVTLPEPATVGLMALSMLYLGRRRRMA